MSVSGFPVVVLTNKPTLDKLWSEAQGIMHVVNSAMLPIFRLFVIDVDHRFSPF